MQILHANGVLHSLIAVFIHDFGRSSSVTEQMDLDLTEKKVFLCHILTEWGHFNGYLNNA